MKEEALKLADELQDYMTSLGWQTHQAPEMIRRLVEELDKQCEPYVWHMKSNDPDSVKDYWYFIDKPSRESKISHQAIPLYTKPQAKPLSDEEIMAETVKAGLTAFKDTNIVLLEHATGELIEFARAIEERHGIK